MCEFQGLLHEITQRHADNGRLCGMGDVVVASRKWNGDFHRRTVMAEVGTDALGTWLWMPDGTVVETPSGSSGNSRPSVGPSRGNVVGVLRAGPPSSATSEAAVRRHHDTRDAAGNLIEFIDLDLDLDVEQLDDGQVRVLDRDEFTTHSRTWAYPHELVHAAEATCQTIVGAVNSGEPPFDGSEIPWWPSKAEDRVFDLPAEDRSGPSRGSTADDSG